MLLLFIMIGTWACSTDNEEDFGVSDSNSIIKQNAVEQFSTLPPTSCFTGLTGQVRVDVSNGLNNPVVIFTPQVTGNVSATAIFNVRVEVQALSNCDDMGSTVGGLLVFGPAGTVNNVVASPPSISVVPSNLPSCYKWRFVFEGNLRRNPICYTASQWYESPLF